jgi:hypothetical protein
MKNNCWSAANLQIPNNGTLKKKQKKKKIARPVVHCMKTS